MDIKKLLDHAPSELSGGQKQRVSMAGVLVDDVDILLFDEPLANLDPATGKRAIDLIDRIHKEQKKTVLIIEHRLEDVLYRDVDRIVVIGDGRVVSDQTPDELLCGDVLEREGIREPLYVTALKHAGCRVQACDHPQHIETMRLEPYREKVQEWYQKVSPPPLREEKATALEVLDLDFSYISGNPVLSNIDFKIHKGEMLAIVGKKRGGKEHPFQPDLRLYQSGSGENPAKRRGYRGKIHQGEGGGHRTGDAEPQSDDFQAHDLR